MGVDSLWGHYNGSERAEIHIIQYQLSAKIPCKLSPKTPYDTPFIEHTLQHTYLNRTVDTPLGITCPLQTSKPVKILQASQPLQHVFRPRCASIASIFDYRSCYTSTAKRRLRARSDGFVSCPVEPRAPHDGGDVLGEVERGCNDDHRKEKYKEGVEYELFRRRQHVEREGDFILVALPLQPAEEGRCVEHYRASVLRRASIMVRDTPYRSAEYILGQIPNVTT